MYRDQQTSLLSWITPRISTSVHSAQGQVLQLQVQEPRLQFFPKAGLPLQTQESRLQFHKRLNRSGSFPLLCSPHSLFSIWTDLKRSEKIPGGPKWRWGEWIWLIEPSGLHRNSPQGLNINSWPDERSENLNQSSSPCAHKAKIFNTQNKSSHTGRSKRKHYFIQWLNSIILIKMCFPHKLLWGNASVEKIFLVVGLLTVAKNSLAAMVVMMLHSQKHKIFSMTLKL